MRRLILLGTLVLLVGVMVGCSPNGGSNTGYKEAYFGDSQDFAKAGFDFNEGVAVHDTVADLVVEPWWDNGSPKPDFQLTTWGDSTKKIVDIGNISLDDAVSMNSADLAPDTITQDDMWDVYPTTGHSYYLTTREGLDVFFHLDSMKVVQDSNNYTSDYWIHYLLK